MTALTREEICARIACAVNPILLIHRKPDADALGSAAALAHYYTACGQTVSIDCADPIPARLMFLTEGLELAPIGATDGRTVISLDVASPAQLGSLADKYTPDFMIDHHAVGTPFAPHYIVPDISSTGEVLYDLLLSPALDPVAETPAVASALYAAISSDTGCFRYSNVTPATLSAAANLLSRGIDAAHINHLLFDSKSRGQLAAEALAGTHLLTAAEGRIAYACLAREEILPIGDEHFETAIDIVRSLAGAEIALVLKEQADGSIRGSLRSTGADVASVAMHFGGGGHVRAAGFTLASMTLDEATALVLPKLEEKLS